MRWLALAYLAAVHVALVWLLREHVHAGQEAAAEHDATLIHGLRRAAQMPQAVAVVGDSRVQDFAVSALGGPTEAYGIGSETVDQVAARLPLYHFDRARAVVLEPGINDWWSNRFDGFEARYRRLLAAVPPGIPVVAAGLIGVDESAAHRRWRGVNARIGETNAAIRQLCSVRPYCVYAPPFARSLPAAMHVGDGVHLSSDGNRRLAVSLQTALAGAR